jgi:hypothetical protein
MLHRMLLALAILLLEMPAVQAQWDPQPTRAAVRQRAPFDPYARRPATSYAQRYSQQQALQRAQQRAERYGQQPAQPLAPLSAQAHQRYDQRYDQQATYAANPVQSAVAWQQGDRNWVDPVGLQWLDPNPGYERVAQLPASGARQLPARPMPQVATQQIPTGPVMTQGVPGEPDCPPTYGDSVMPGFIEPDCAPPGPPIGFMPHPGAPPGQMPLPQLPPQPQQAPVPEPYRPLLPPNVIGNLMGTRPQLMTMSFDHAFPVRGTIISGAPGSAAAVLAFEQNGGFPNDFTSIPGSGRDTTGDGFADLFDMAEPLPPNEVPTSPGAGFEYQGGTVAYTNSPTATTPQNGQFMNNELWFAEYSFAKSLQIPAGGALSIRRMHVAENNSPLPSDRVFFDYRFFSEPLGTSVDNHWYTFGLERTFFSGRTSIDARLPFAYTIDGEQYEDDMGMRGMELGNLAFTLKQVFWGTDRWLLSGGTGVSLPTGDETRIFLADGTQVLVIDNDAIHLQPFLGGIWLPNELFFLQGFVQVNLDLQGNDVRGNIGGGRLPTIGTLNSPMTLLADLSGGMWVYSNPMRSGWLQAVAIAGELSAETPLEDAEIVMGNGITVSDISRELDQLNATLATHAYVGTRLALTGGVTMPLRSGEEKEFDWSAVFMANWLF